LIAANAANPKSQVEFLGAFLADKKTLILQAKLNSMNIMWDITTI
jgi:hypothetical protein